MPIFFCTVIKKDSTQLYLQKILICDGFSSKKHYKWIL